MKWLCTIEVPDHITKEQLQGELSEDMAAGFDLDPEQYNVTVEELPKAA